MYRFYIFVIILGLILGTLFLYASNAYATETVDRLFTFETSTQDWIELGSGSYTTASGTPAGSWMNRRTTCPGELNFCQSVMTWEGTWSELFQVYTPFFISSINPSFANVSVSYDQPTGEKQHRFEILDRNFEHLADIIQEHLHPNDEGEFGVSFGWITEPEACQSQQCLPGATITYETLGDFAEWDSEIKLRVTNSIDNYTGFQPVTTLVDEFYIRAEIASTTVFHPSWFINTVSASTTCEFVTLGVTTTAECSDARINSDNSGLNVALGLIIFFITFFGLIFYFRKGVR